MNTDAQALKGLISFLVKGSIDNKKNKINKKEEKKTEEKKVKEPDIIESEILAEKDSPKAIMMSLSALSAKSAKKMPFRKEDKEEGTLHDKKRINKKWKKK